jgi:glycerol-3-phosphate acyltransferase PlsY
LDIGLAVVAILLGYLMGSVPSAYILLRLVKRIDIRTTGSGNVGALNTYQQLGPIGGIGVLLADVSKGVLAVYLPQWIGAPDWAGYGSAVSVVAGHTWPLFLGFRGGKGAATALGVGLALAPIPVAIGLVPVIIFGLAIRNIVIGVVIGLVLVNTVAIITGESWALVVTFLVLTSLLAGNYLARTINQTVAAIHQKRWGRMVFRE